jgi:prepilin-type N-terminal cleavage/methylation domain-containing protein
MSQVRQTGQPQLHPGGFTLAEVVVALTLFALTAVVITQAVLNAQDTYRRLSQIDPRDEALPYVRQAILSLTERSEVEEGGTVVTPQGLTGEWEAVLLPTQVLDLFLLRYTVEWKDNTGQEAPVTREVYVFRPGWSDSAVRQELRDRRLEWFNELRGGEAAEPP